MKLTGHGLVVDGSLTTMSSGKTSPLVSFLYIHFIFLFSSPSLCSCVSAHMCVYVCVPLPSFLSTWLHVRFMRCQFSELHPPSPLPLSHFRPSYFTHVATCNLRTSSPGSSSLPSTQPSAQGSIPATLVSVR